MVYFLKLNIQYKIILVELSTKYCNCSFLGFQKTLTNYILLD